VSLSAAQLMRVTAPVRPDSAWTVSASTSLPTPVSPRMTTLVSVAATSRTSRGTPAGVGSMMRVASRADSERLSPLTPATRTNENGPM
jgi:hypothetical protein